MLAIRCAHGGLGRVDSRARPPMVYQYGSDVRAHAADCFANPPYGLILNREQL